jgi:hypothetical protein
MKWGGWLGVAGGALAAALIGCNGLLGIGAASLESEDGGSPDASNMPNCTTYCSVIMQNCTGNNAEYLSAAICASMCPAFETSTTIADTANDTLGCRMYFANQAAQTPATSCRFAGPLGGGHCGGNPCSSFCDLDMGYCTGDKPVPYEGGIPGCQSGCATYPYLTVDAGDTTSDNGNTLNCRLWHLETAYTNDDFGKFHCPHTELVSSLCKDGDGG